MTEITTDRYQLDGVYQLENQGLLQEALDECDRVIQATPDLAEAYNLKGIILDQLGKTDEAITAYRMAIDLQPEFNEAKQNLREVLEEADSPGQDFDIKQAAKMAWVGAWGFGISFAIANMIQGLVSIQSVMGSSVGNTIFSRIFNSGMTLLFSSILYAIGIGAGTAILARVIDASKRNTLVMANTVGFGIAYLIVGMVTQFVFAVFNVVGFFNSLNLAFTVREVVEFGVPGMIVGLYFDLVLFRSREHVRWSVIAGSVFGLAGLVSNICFNLSSEIVRGIIVSITHDYENGYNLLPWIYFPLQGIITGGAAGAALGYVQSYFGGVRRIEE